MPTYKDLGKTFNNLELAIKDEIINIIPNAPNKKFSYYEWSRFKNKPYPLTKHDFDKVLIELKDVITTFQKKIETDKSLTNDDKDKIKKDISKIQNIKTSLKDHKGNFGIIIGYNPNNTPYWLGCLDIDGVNTDNETEKQTQKEFIEILKKLEGTILIQTQGGGYHLYFLTKKSYFPETITNLCFPEDYHIKKLANQDIANHNDSIELFTNNNRQMAIPPSRIGKREYNVLSDLKDFNKLKVYDDILETVYKLFKEQRYTIKEKEPYIISDTPLTSDEKNIQPVEINTEKTPEITPELIENTLKCYYTGCMDKFGFRLSDMLVRDGWSEKQLRKLFEKLPHDDIKKCYKWINQSLNKPENKLTGWKSFRKAIYRHCKPEKDAPVVEKFFMDFINYGKIRNINSTNKLNKEKRIVYCQSLINDLKNNKDSQPFNNLILKHLENINKRYTYISSGTPYIARIIDFNVTPITKHTYYNLKTLKLCSRAELTGEIIYTENKNGTISPKLWEYKKIPPFEIVEDEYNKLNDLDTTNYIKFKNGILNTKKGTFEKELFPDLKIEMKNIDANYKEDNKSLEKLWNIFGKNFKDIRQFQIMLADITHLRIDDIGWAVISTFGTGKDFILAFLRQLAPVEEIQGATFNEETPRFSKNIINKNTFAINEANTLNKVNQLIDIISGNKFGFNIKYGDYYIAENPKLLLFGNSLKPVISNNNQLSEKLIYCDMNQHNFREDIDKLDRHRDWSKEIRAFYYWLFNTANLKQMKKEILKLATKTREEGIRAVNIDDLIGEYYEIDNSTEFIDSIDKHETILYDDFRTDINKIIEKHNIGEKFENNRSGKVKIGYLLNRFFNEVLSNKKGFIYIEDKYGNEGIKEIRYKQRKTIEGKQKNVLVGIKKIKEI